MKIRIANALLFSVLEYGLWPFLPMLSLAEENLREADMLILCWIVGIQYEIPGRRKVRYERLCAFLGLLPIMERLWVKARKTGKSRHQYLCTIPTTLSPYRGSRNINSHIGPLDIMAESVTKVTGRRLIPPWQRCAPFDDVFIAETKEAAQQAHNDWLPTYTGIVIYTDGSKKGARNGSGFAIYTNGYEVAAVAAINRLPEYGGVYDSELLAIMAALQHVLTLPEIQREPFLTMPGLQRQSGLPSVTVVTDSQSAARALSQIPIWHTLEAPLSMAIEAIQEARQALEPGATLSLRWVPGHREIQGNERADEMANMAADMMTLSLEPDEAPIMDEALAKAWVRAQQRYNAITASRTQTAVGALYHKIRGREFRSADLQLTTEQTIRRVMWLGGYAFSRRAADPIKTCPECLADVYAKTSQEAHLLLECPFLAPLRSRYDIVQHPDDADDWLMQRPGIDAFLLHLEEVKQTHKLHAAASIEAPTLPAPEHEIDAILVMAMAAPDSNDETSSSDEDMYDL